MEVQQVVLSGNLSTNVHPFKLNPTFQAQFLGPDAAFPSPLSWIFYLARFIYKWKGGRQRDSFEHKKYFSLLKSIIQTRQKTVEERTEEVHLADLKTDLVRELKLIYLKRKTTRQDSGN